jgi:hypothetical protein
MRKIRTFATMVFAAALPAFAADFPPPPDGSADQVMTLKDGKTVETKVYFAGKRSRFETKGTVVVVDFEKKAQWVVLPPPMGCLEQPFKQDPRSFWATPSDSDAKIDLVGKEKVDGHPADKYRISGTANGKPYEVFVWRATDLQGFPIKQAAADGSFESHFKNVKLGKPSAELFTKPGDCKAQPDFANMLKSMQQGQPHGHEGGGPGH